MSKYKVVNSPRSQVTQGELLERDGSTYILPPASESEMGGVRVGQRLYMVGNILNAVDQRYDDTALALAVADNAADIQDLADALVPDLSGYATDAELTAGDVATLAAAKVYADEQVPDLSGYATIAGAVPKSLIDAKGDLLVGSANDTIVRLPVGPNGSLLMADSNTATGLSYQSPAPLLVNLLTNSDFSNGTTGWFGTGGSLTNEGNTLILTAADAVTPGYVRNNVTILAGHRYYVSVRFTPFRTHNLLISLGGDYPTSPNPASAGIATQVSATVTALQAGVSVGFYSNAGVVTGQTTGARAGFDNAVCIDLTATFGAGFEPTKSEMDALMAQWGGWFADTDPKLLPSYAWAKRTQNAARNLVTNGDLSNGTTGWIGLYSSLTASAAWGELTATVVTPHTAARIEISEKTIPGRMYYMRCDLFPKYVTDTTLRAGGSAGVAQSITANAWNKLSAVVTAIDSDVFRFYHSTATGGYLVGDTYKYRRLLTIDLTATFGAGNEPTKSEMDLLLSKYPNSWFNGTVNDLVKDFDKWNRRGTGSPEGVVTAAPGVKWTDTANTNGAREWRKDTGTGNTGWVVTNGDTGWRDIRTLYGALVAQASASAKSARIRRVNTAVYYECRVSPAGTAIGTNRTVALASIISVIPTGFRNDDTYLPYGIAGRGNYFGALTTLNTSTRLDYNSPANETGTWTGTDVVTGSASWATADVWPSTLPGTPA